MRSQLLNALSEVEQRLSISSLSCILKRLKILYILNTKYPWINATGLRGQENKYILIKCMNDEILVEKKMDFA